MKSLKQVTLTKRQIDDVLDKLFDIVEARMVMSNSVYDYAWTIWASRRDVRDQGSGVVRMSKRQTEIKP